ncbi:Tol-Pal system beta propeller repeat protein TolB [bacterium]|nr:Tol-Pal system beta propeller repeat protein TolB [bacterium]
MKLFIQILVLLTLLTPVYSQTQTDQQRIEGEISKPGFEPIPAMIPKPFVATPDAGPAAEELATVLGNDLYNSDYFEMIDASAYPPYTGQIKISDYKTSRAKYVALLKVSLEGSQVNVEARFYDVQSEQLVVGKVYKWDRKFVRHIAHRFGDEILYRLWGVKGIFTSKLAFSSDRSGNRDVWLMDYDGYNQTQVTKSKHINLSPDLSPDGKQVIYTTYRAEQAATGQMLIVYNIYDGKKSTLYSQGTLNSAPAWSSDGSRIAFTSNVKGNAEIYVINKDGSNLKQITFNRAIDTSPAWNPKTGQIAFTSDRSGNPMVYIMNEDGTNEQRLTYVGEYNESAAWSPDGRMLAYVSRSGINFDIYVVDMASNVVTRLTQNEGSNENPCWSPDSRHIAFASNRTGKYQIWTMLFDGSKLRQLTRDGNNTSASWAPGE